MTLQQFIDSNKGKKLDWDGAYGAQCVDLIRFYLRDFGIPQVKPGNAVTWWNNASTNDFEKISNTPSNFPQAGDIVIWNGNIAGGAGHIAIAVPGAGKMSFVSFDQNWPTGSGCHEQLHNYNNVIGWLRPKKASQGGQDLVTRNGLKQIFAGLLMRDPDEGAYNTYVGKPYEQVLGDVHGSAERQQVIKRYAEGVSPDEITKRDKIIKDSETKILSLTDKVKELEGKLILTSQELTDTREAGQKYIEETNKQIQLLEDRIKELEKPYPIPKPPAKPDIVGDFIDKILDSVVNLWRKK